MKNDIIIEKIIKYVNKVINYTENCTYENFSENTVLVEACVFNLGQIGELSNKIDRDFQDMHKDIPWKVLYGLRNRIVHDYEGVNLILIWEIIRNDLPELYIQLQNLISQ